MVEIIWRYRVHPSQRAAFERAYGPAGDWTRLFSRHPGFRRTRLFRHRNAEGVYIVLDVWEHKSDYDDFRRRFAAEYRRLDRQFALLHLEKHLLGCYEGPHEYAEARGGE